MVFAFLPGFSPVSGRQSTTAEGVYLLYIGFDVDDRRPIQGIKPPDLQDAALYPDKIDDREGNRVGAIR